MQFAIPHAPRAVKLSQVPGALKRLALFLLLALLLAAGFAAGASALSASFGEDVARLRRSEKITGRFRDAKLPPVDKREDAIAKMSVLYVFAKQRYSGNGIEISALDAEGLGEGAPVELYVDPADPDHPWEVRLLERRAARADLLPWGLGVGLVLGIGLFGFQLVRTLRRELEPLRKGALVWLTPDGKLPDTKSEIVFAAHYFREDKKFEVKARARPGRAPVRNGEKILAAVVPKRPSWVRVVDEDLARTLGWIR